MRKYDCQEIFQEFQGNNRSTENYQSENDDFLLEQAALETPASIRPLNRPLIDQYPLPPILALII